MAEREATVRCAECGHGNERTAVVCAECREPLARADVTMSGGATVLPGRRSIEDSGAETLSGGRTIGGGGEPASVRDEMRPGLLVGGGQRYEILSKLGEGGMGSVWKAKDMKLGREVAIKRVRLPGEPDRQMYERFRRETQAIVGLSHPNVVTVYDAGEDEYGQYMVMEFVAGRSLAARIASGPIELGDAVDLFLGLCRGVAHAHKRGVIHRDIKPGNVMLDEDSVPKLVDFGLVRMDSASDLSHAGQGMGTMDYAAPEQKQDASAVDGRADVYSLGATFYEMLTRRRPVPLHVAKVPLQWQGIVGKACEPEASVRFQTIDALLAAVDTAGRNETVEASLATLQGEDDLQCPSCKILNTLEARFCRRCGESLRTKCPACDGQLRVGLKHCDQCGANTLSVTYGRKALAGAEAALAEGRLDVVDAQVAEGTQTIRGMRLGGAGALSGCFQEISARRSDHQMRATQEMAQARRQEAEQDFEGALESLKRAATLDRSHHAASEAAARDYPDAITNRDERRARALQEANTLHLSSLAELTAGGLDGARQTAEAGKALLSGLEPDRMRELGDGFKDILGRVATARQEASSLIDQAKALEKKYAFGFWTAIPLARRAVSLDSQHASYLTRLTRIRKFLFILLAPVAGLAAYLFAQSTEAELLLTAASIAGLFVACVDRSRRDAAP